MYLFHLQLWKNCVYFWFDLQAYHQLFYQETLHPFKVCTSVAFGISQSWAAITAIRFQKRVEFIYSFSVAHIHRHWRDKEGGIDVAPDITELPV